MRRFVPCCCLLLLSAAVIALQLHWLRGPLERDVSVYFVAAHRLLEGSKLYLSVWDHKPPAIHILFAAAELLFGYRVEAIAALGSAAAIATLLAIYSIVRSLGGTTVAALFGAVLWTILALSPQLEANQPNTEAFINAFFTVALALWMGSTSRGGFAWGALLFAVSTLFKPVSAILLAPLVMLGRQLGPVGRCAEALLAVAAAWIFVIGYFWAQGRFDQFWSAVVVYNRYYGGDVGSNLALLSDPRNLFPVKLRFLWPLLALGALGILLLAIKRGLPEACGVLALPVAAVLAAALPGKFYLHYYQLAVPGFCIAGAIGLHELLRLGQVARYAAAALALAVLTNIGWHEIRLGTWSSPLNSSDRLTAMQLGIRLHQLLGPHDSLFEFGMDPGIYFFAGKEPPVSVLHCLPLIEGPLAQALTGVVMRQLTASPPEIVVIDRELWDRSGRNHPLRKFIESRYQQTEWTPSLGKYVSAARNGWTPRPTAADAAGANQ